jgi:predicted nucleotidyltransferase
MMLYGKDWSTFVPTDAAKHFQGAALHSLAAGERAVLAKLRTMKDEDFEALHYGSEGLCRKLMKEGRKGCSIAEIANGVKSKRYTRSRIDRMILCAFLGLTAKDLSRPAPYARVLALNRCGGEILKKARNTGWYPNIGEQTTEPFEALERQADDLYGLFALGEPEAGYAHRRQRVLYSGE